jgi:thiol-disulfide isomerase/thioredoxin
MTRQLDVCSSRLPKLQRCAVRGHSTAAAHAAHCRTSHIVRSAERAAALADLHAQKAGLSKQLKGVEEGLKQGQKSASINEASLADSRTMGQNEVSVDEESLEGIEEIFIENYHDKIKGADAPVVLVDFYTQWCGPCKLMYPKLCQLKADLKGKVRSLCAWIGVVCLSS